MPKLLPSIIISVHPSYSSLHQQLYRLINAGGKAALNKPKIAQTSSQTLFI
jgi:hypothetical protein